MATILDAATQGPEGRVFDGSHVTATINGKPAPENALRGMTPGLSVTGKEYVYALGRRHPFAQTRGVVEPNELVLQVFASVSPQFLRLIDPNGFFLDAQADIVITYDEASSPGSSLIQSALKLPTSSITIEKFEVTGVSDSIEVGGGVIVTEIKGRPLMVRMGGMAGAAK